jgi:hypothetical protein
MRLFVVVRGVNVLEGRLRPFPAKPVVGPAFTPGLEEAQSFFYSLGFAMSAAFTRLLPHPAAGAR